MTSVRGKCEKLRIFNPVEVGTDIYESELREGSVTHLVVTWSTSDRNYRSKEFEEQSFSSKYQGSKLSKFMSLEVQFHSGYLAA
jgi:hypothetical protein